MAAPAPGKLARFVRSPWFSLLVGVVVGVLWLVVEEYVLGRDESTGAKVVSATVSALVGALATLLVQLYGQLENVVGRFDRLETLVTELQSGVEDFHRLEERLLPSLYVSPGMKGLHAELLAWRAHIDTGNGHRASPLERHAWAALADAYFRGESERIQSKTFKTTSDQYTTLVNEVTQTLAGTFAGQDGGRDRVRLIRVHLTGMLPEEFYNGPQIEYSRRGSEPLFFSHRWEDYPVLYGDEYRADPSTRIRRHIVVRQPDFQRPELSALSTLPDLRAQARLVIGGEDVRLLINDVEREHPAVLRRLLRWSPLPPGSAKAQLDDVIRTVHGFDRYGYWPIAEHDAVDEADPRQSWMPLLDFFARHYHGDSVDDAVWFALDERGWATCAGDEQLQACFSAGWTPEVALFGSEHEDGPFWYFGILGLWRPFTRDMQLRFLTGPETARLHGSVNRMRARCRANGTIRTLTAVTA
ncbi:hypothetical protein [Pseudonocardia sp.]|uniref:hypothetical protein n=1 Tax=Pseudonocardia sp. TaxID=60912 RepID=UPI003D0C9766